MFLDIKKTIYFIGTISFLHSPISMAQSAAGNKALTVDWLLDTALKNGKTPELLKNKLSGIESNVLRASAVTDTKLKSKITYTDDKLDRSSVAMGDSQSERISAGLSKGFLTGTQLSGEVYTNRKSTEIVSQAGLQSTNASYFESGASLALRQSFLKNSFGSANQYQLDSANFKNKSTTLKTKADVENYLSSLVERYYSAWVLIKNHEAASSRLKREKRRLSTYESQFKRGFLEKTDYLQVKSSYLSSKSMVTDAYANIETVLIILSDIVGIDLQSMYSRNPKLVKLIIPDNRNSNQICLRQPKKFHSYQSESFVNEMSSIDKSLLAIKSNGRADLYFEAKLDSNGIDAERGETFNETQSTINSKMYLGIGFEMPLGGDSLNRADTYDALRRKSSNEISLRQNKDSLLRSWKTGCHDIKVALIKRKNLKERVKIETERVKLLDKDFNVGKVDINTLLQAETGLESLLTSLNKLDANLAVNVWNVKKLNGAYTKMVDGYLN